MLSLILTSCLCVCVGGGTVQLVHGCNRLAVSYASVLYVLFPPHGSGGSSAIQTTTTSSPSPQSPSSHPPSSSSSSSTIRFVDLKPLKLRHPAPFKVNNTVDSSFLI